MDDSKTNGTHEPKVRLVGRSVRAPEFEPIPDPSITETRRRRRQDESLAHDRLLRAVMKARGIHDEATLDLVRRLTGDIAMLADNWDAITSSPPDAGAVKHFETDLAYCLRKIDLYMRYVTQEDDSAVWSEIVARGEAEEGADPDSPDYELIHTSIDEDERVGLILAHNARLAEKRRVP